MRISGSRKNQRGASALIVAASMLLLIGMAAIAIDVGAGFNERRQNQSSADVGVLAGAIDQFDLGLCGGSSDGGCDEILSFVRDNLRETYAEADWVAAWRSCLDPDKDPDVFTPLRVDTSAWTSFTDGRVDCISASPQELRVRVPDQFTDTAFGTVLGVNELTTSAVAQAALVVDAGRRGVLPFGVLANASAQVCLLAAPSGIAVEPCAGSDSGNFYAINSESWGPPSSTTTSENCVNGVPNTNALALNVANGLDHFISTTTRNNSPGTDFSPGNPNVYSFATNNAAQDATTRLDDCRSGSAGAEPVDTDPDTGFRDTVRASTGSAVAAAVKAGLFSGQAGDFSHALDPGSVVPRLLQNDDCELPSGAPCGDRELSERVGGQNHNYDANDVPLWEYLDTSVVVPIGVQTDCSITLMSDVDTTDEMACLLTAHGNGDFGGTVIFDDSIDTNPRFAWAPRFWYNAWGPGSHWQPVKGYAMVYLHSLWFNCDGSDTTCSGGAEFQPGDTPSSTICLGNGNNCAALRLDQVSAFIIPSGSVPAEIETSFPGGPNTDFEVILTK